MSTRTGEGNSEKGTAVEVTRLQVLEGCVEDEVEANMGKYWSSHAVRENLIPEGGRITARIRRPKAIATNNFEATHPKINPRHTAIGSPKTGDLSRRKPKRSDGDEEALEFLRASAWRGKPTLYESSQGKKQTKGSLNERLGTWELAQDKPGTSRRHEASLPSGGVMR